jgi:hypothetical protein
MISVTDHQLRIVAAAADQFAVEARGTFLRRVVAELRRRQDFSDSDVEQAVSRGAARPVSGTISLTTMLRGASRPDSSVPRFGPTEAADAFLGTASAALRQPRDVGGHAPGLIGREQLCRRAASVDLFKTLGNAQALGEVAMGRIQSQN